MGRTTTFDEHVEKCLLPRERSEPEALERLRSEAALLGLLSDLAITPRLLMRGEDAQRGPWHRTERIRIPTLAERLAILETTSIDASWIERAVGVLFRSLAKLHEAVDEKGPLAIVHADLSPANIAIDDRAETAVLLDLDLAWWRDGAARSDGAFRGTIAYAAPEVARGERPTVASDLFSLSATLLHAVTGAPPRTSDSFAALLARAAESPLLTSEAELDLRARGPGHAALVRCLAHDARDRPPSARAVLAMLGLC